MKDAFDIVIVVCLLAVMFAAGHLITKEYDRVMAPKPIVVNYSGLDMVA